MHRPLGPISRAGSSRGKIGQTLCPFRLGLAWGPYEILAPIGAGGMGEVYQARDTRLGRTTAIKILPVDKVGDCDRKRRFLQEARAASALNHPNIVTVHDIASDSGVDYMVMEYVPGRSLDRLMASKALPPAEAIEYALQIASALAAAHAAGIVHRDVKPGNVMITADSQVKVLDFGLSKLMELGSGPEDETQTQASAVTETGTVMGTVAYMSPEQASGRPVDHRTDIFSLGVVLYEMLAGRRPFRGRSQVETMHEIINAAAPSLDEQPPELNDVLERALAKDPKDRFQHAGDLALDLKRLLRKPLRPISALPRPGRTRYLASATMAVLLLAVPGAWWLGRRESIAVANPLADAKFTRFTDFGGINRDAAISPDGKFVAFVSNRDGPMDVWISQVGSGRFENLTHGALLLDSLLRVVGFTGDGTEIWLHDLNPLSPLLKRPLMGGPLRIFLSKSPAKTPPINAAWSPDGARIVYYTSDDGDPLFVTDRTGGNARQIYIDRPGIHNHYPAWSPDGRWVYFVRGTPTTGEMDPWQIPAGGGKPERLTNHNSNVSYPAPAGERTVFYVAQDQDGSGPWMWALDTERKVTRRVSFGLEKYTSVTASADGRRLVATVANPSAGLWSLPILDRVAEERDVKSFVVPTVRALALRFRGSSLFYLSSRGTGDGLWRYREGQALEIWKGSEGALLEPAAVSPDGRRIAFVLRRNGKRQMQLATAEGSELQAIGEDIDIRGAPDWSSDGKWIAVGGVGASGPGLFKSLVRGICGSLIGRMVPGRALA